MDPFEDPSGPYFAYRARLGLKLSDSSLAGDDGKAGENDSLKDVCKADEKAVPFTESNIQSPKLPECPVSVASTVSPTLPTTPSALPAESPSVSPDTWTLRTACPARSSSLMKESAPVLASEPSAILIENPPNQSMVFSNKTTQEFHPVSPWLQTDSQALHKEHPVPVQRTDTGASRNVRQDFEMEMMLQRGVDKTGSMEESLVPVDCLAECGESKTELPLTAENLDLPFEDAVPKPPHSSNQATKAMEVAIVEEPQPLTGVTGRRKGRQSGRRKSRRSMDFRDLGVRVDLTVEETESGVPVGEAKEDDKEKSLSQEDVAPVSNDMATEQSGPGPESPVCVVTGRRGRRQPAKSLSRRSMDFSELGVKVDSTPEKKEEVLTTVKTKMDLDEKVSQEDVSPVCKDMVREQSAPVCVVTGRRGRRQPAKRPSRRSMDFTELDVRVDTISEDNKDIVMTVKTDENTRDTGDVSQGPALTVDTLDLPFDSEDRKVDPEPAFAVVLPPSKSKRKGHRRSSDVEVTNIVSEVSPDAVPDGYSDLPPVPGSRRSTRLRRKSIELFKASQRKQDQSSIIEIDKEVSKAPLAIERELGNLVKSCAPALKLEARNVGSDKCKSTQDESECLDICAPVQDQSENLSENMMTAPASTSPVRSGDSAVDTHESPSPPKRKRGRAPKSKEPEMSEQPTPQPPKKRGPKRKIIEESVEDIYLNKLWRTQMPKVKMWETIFEQPQALKGKGKVEREAPAASETYLSSRKFKRAVDFDEFYAQARLKRRRQKAVKQGWKPMTKKKSDSMDTLLLSKLDELDLAKKKKVPTATLR